MKYTILPLILMMFLAFSCQDQETEVKMDSEEEQLLQMISSEGKAMINHSFNDLNHHVSTVSVNNLSEFDSEEFAKKSVLEFVQNSEISRPHFQLIQSSLTFGSSEARPESLEADYTETEQLYISKLTDTFDLLPDLTLFNESIEDIKNEIISEVTDEEVRMKLLTICVSSATSANYLLENEYEIISEFVESATAANGRTEDCCFEGDLEWDWVEFGSAVVGAAAGSAARAWVINVLPGGGQAAYGTAVVGGAVAGAAGYTAVRFYQWMFSTGGTGSCDDQVSFDCRQQ
ncbi:MAG: hypothetical protein AAFQ94_25655 [Bacteroidota bacterium]